MRRYNRQTQQVHKKQNDLENAYYLSKSGLLWQIKRKLPLNTFYILRVLWGEMVRKKLPRSNNFKTHLLLVSFIMNRLGYTGSHFKDSMFVQLLVGSLLYVAILILVTKTILCQLLCISSQMMWWYVVHIMMICYDVIICCAYHHRSSLCSISWYR